jgi:hypothetical protein
VSSSNAECTGFFHRSLFFMGEFGVNDYSFSVFGKTLTQIRSLVPDVVKTISAATEVINPLNGLLRFDRGY